LRVIDRKIAAYTADDAAVVVRETVEQINQSGATPDKAAKVQRAMFTLVSNRRCGMSSDAVRKKIAWLMTPHESHGVRVADSWNDFVGMIQSKEMKGIPQTQERLPVQPPLGDKVDPKLQARGIHTTKERAA